MNVSRNRKHSQLMAAERVYTQMLESMKNKLDEVNKLIFVKYYEEAEQLLNQIVSTDDARLNLLVQLRRVELSLKLEKVEGLRDEYVELLAENPDESAIWETCILFAEQHAELIPDVEAVHRFQALLQKYDPSAAAYFGIAFSMECQGNLDRAVFNYEQAINLDQNWFPAYFGLSQIFYSKDDEQTADHYFYLFEQSAPYNLYGNFETHKNLCADFLEREDFSAAEAAITALSDWWSDHKGICPPEIQIYEHLSVSKIDDYRGDLDRSEQMRSRAILLANRTLQSNSMKESVLYFIAKVLEEFSEFDLALQYYKTILRKAGRDPSMVQKIGSQFLSLGEHRLAKELFDEAYDSNPDNAEIRFCRLVSDLKVEGVNVEDYLIGRERLGKLVDSDGDKVELLALLHSLLAKYQGDVDVHSSVADVYLRLGNIERAAKHFDTMYSLDGKCRGTATKYASFIMQNGDPETAMDILKSIDIFDGSSEADAEFSSEVKWLKANYFYRTGLYLEALDLVKSILKIDPWNVSYLVQEAMCLSSLLPDDLQEVAFDSTILKLSNSDEDGVDWGEFMRSTEILAVNHKYDLCYCRSKICFLYASGDMDLLRDVVSAAGRFDPSQGTYDFLRLLNTNFDGAGIYMSLGILYKEMWQLEAATVWFNQVLMHPHVGLPMKVEAYLEIADCYAWQNQNLPKAIEYAKMAMDLSKERSERAVVILAHVYLKHGKMREAKIYLDQSDSSESPEAAFLEGLYHYRNGLTEKANAVWKPLLCLPSQNLRSHNMKQEVLRFYFDHEPYLKAN